MATYRDSKCRLCRREGRKTLPERATDAIRASARLKNVPLPPGAHGASAVKKFPNTASSLREKQKTKRIYGVQEGQFSKYYEMADRMKGITGENMLSLLERRLDNVIYRMGIGGIACAGAPARQPCAFLRKRQNGQRSLRIS